MSSIGLDVSEHFIAPAGSQKSKLFAIQVNGVTIDIGIFNYSDRQFIILTQFGKLGSLVSVSRNAVLAGDERKDLYEVKTIFGDDRLEYHVVARALAESLPENKPILFGIALRDVTFPTVELIRRALVENKTW